jgi:hypothetical protein
MVNLNATPAPYSGGTKSEKFNNYTFKVKSQGAA